MCDHRSSSLCSESLATSACTFPTKLKRFLPGASLSNWHLSMFLCRACGDSRDLGDSSQQNVIGSLSVVDSGIRNFRSSNFGRVKPSEWLAHPWGILGYSPQISHRHLLSPEACTLCLFCASYKPRHTCVGNASHSPRTGLAS